MLSFVGKKIRFDVIEIPDLVLFQFSACDALIFELFHL
jgi:hypothetical protein